MSIGAVGFIVMLDHGYFFRQIRMLLKFARLTSDPLFAALLVEKAAKASSMKANPIALSPAEIEEAVAQAL